MSRYPLFDRDELVVEPLTQREHLLWLPDCLASTEGPPPLGDHPAVVAVAKKLRIAKLNDRARIAAMGAHVLRAGCGPHLIEMMENGELSLLAFNGAGAIHDYEFALVGATTESVPKYIADGRFGLWRETGVLNEVVRTAATCGMGLGEALGKIILEADFPHKEHSVFAAAYRLGVPATVHVGIGYDIVFEHPNCDAAAWGTASYTDFLIFAREVQRLEGGVFCCLGSAVMGPEVYLKALAMARNVARQKGERIADFTTLVGDLIPIHGDPHAEAPKTDPQYYYRPYKTILVRTVADGGESHYVAADHKHTVPTLLHHLRRGRSTEGNGRA
jgi:hypothetical protein